MFSELRYAHGVLTYLLKETFMRLVYHSEAYARKSDVQRKGARKSCRCSLLY